MRSQILLDYVIRPALHKMGEKYYSNGSCQQMLATCAQESNCGKYIKQVNGPALGIMQIEPATHKSIWVDYIDYNYDLKRLMLSMLPDSARGDGAIAFNARNNCLINNLEYAVCIARLVYYRTPYKMPEVGDKQGAWKVYKKVYNTEHGKATEEEFMHNWVRFLENINY